MTAVSVKRSIMTPPFGVYEFVTVVEFLLNILVNNIHF